MNRENHAHIFDEPSLLPWVPEVFSRAQRMEILRFASAAPETAHEKPLAPRVSAYGNGASLTNFRGSRLCVFIMASFTIFKFYLGY